MELLLNDQKQNPMLRALRFMWAHREGPEALTFHVKDETLLVVKPTEVARKHATEITELKDALLIFTKGRMCEQYARTLVVESIWYFSQIFKGFLLEVNDYVEHERPDIWKQGEDLRDTITLAVVDQDWRLFNRSLCQWIDLHELMLEEWKSKKGKAA